MSDIWTTTYLRSFSFALFVIGFWIINANPLDAQSASILHTVGDQKPPLNGWSPSTIDTVIYFDPRLFPLGIDSTRRQPQKTLSSPYEPNQSLYRLQQTGSISRGLIIGTNTDASIESGMDLNIYALLADSIRISASLTDQNTPIQPDGSSLQLREFDRVLLQLEAPTTQASMGDIDIQLAPHPFLMLNRRAMGAQFSTSFSTERTPGLSHSTSASLSVLRGRYQVKMLPTTEGFQGPYRLSNDNGEPFVVVLAGSERIFLNGQKLQRGADADYTIDYSFGEILFTSNILIRASDRIRVEYQYLDQAYPELIGSASYRLESQQGWSIAYQMAGSRAVLSGGLASELSDAELDVLRQAGDNTNALVFQRAREIGQDPAILVRYSALDTTINGQKERIFVYDPDGNLEVRFQRVDNNTGSYERLVDQTVNGVIYRFVGRNQGDYSPNARLASPEALTVQSVAFDWQPKKSSAFVRSNLALSLWDKNRISSKDDADNAQLAGSLVLGTPLWNGAQLKAEWEQSSSRFVTFDRVRDPEFEREWGGLAEASFGQQIAGVSLEQRWSEQSHSSVSYARLEQGSTKVDRFQSQNQINEGVFAFRSSFKRASYSRLDQQGAWLQVNSTASLGEIGDQAWRLQPAIRLDLEHSNAPFLSDIPGGPNLNQPNFSEAAFKLKYLTKANGYLSGELGRRVDEFSQFDQGRQRQRNAWIYRLQQERNGEIWQSKVTVQWFDVPSEPSFSTNIQQRIRLPEDRLSLRVAYQADSRLQGRLQQIYTYVGPQFGQYYWDDLNQDGVQQLDEFFPERVPEEGEYILQLLPSDRLEGITDVKLQNTFSIQPFSFLQVFNNSWLKEITFGLDWLVQEQNTSTQIGALLRLDSELLRKEAYTLFGLQKQRYELGWRSVDRHFQLESYRSKLQNLSNRTGFIERSSQQEYGVALRYQPTLRRFLRLALAREERNNQAQALQNRNFNYHLYRFRSSFSWRIGRTIDHKTELNLRRGEEAVSGLFRSVRLQHQLSRRLSGGSLSWLPGVQYSDFEQAPSAFAGFELTGGQGEGLQMFSDLRYQVSLKSGFRLLLNYSVRSRRSSPILQTATIRLSSTF